MGVHTDGKLAIIPIDPRYNCPCISSCRSLTIFIFFVYYSIAIYVYTILSLFMGFSSSLRG